MKIEYREVDLTNRMQVAQLAHFLTANRDTKPHELDQLWQLPTASLTSPIRVYVAAIGATSVAKVVGCAAFSSHESLFGRKWWVENVLVANDLRGQGIGAGLMKHLAEQAAGHGIAKLHLTSNPKRVAANGLYLKLGWTPYDTNVYHLDL